jgi:hypothetical protein
MPKTGFPSELFFTLIPGDGQTGNPRLALYPFAAPTIETVTRGSTGRTGLSSVNVPPMPPHPPVTVAAYALEGSRIAHSRSIADDPAEATAVSHPFEV